MSELLPAEQLAANVARAQLRRGANPEINTTAALLLAVERLTGNDIKMCEGAPGEYDVICGNCGAQSIVGNVPEDFGIPCEVCGATRCPRCCVWFGGES